MLGNLGVAYEKLGEMRRGFEFFEQQLAITREIGDNKEKELRFSTVVWRLMNSATVSGLLLMQRRHSRFLSELNTGMPQLCAHYWTSGARVRSRMREAHGELAGWPGED